MTDTATPDPATITLAQTLQTEKAAAQAIATAFAAFKDAVADAMATLPVATAYNPQVRSIATAVIQALNFQLANQLPVLIASYDPPATA